MAAKKTTDELAALIDGLPSREEIRAGQLADFEENLAKIPAGRLRTQTLISVADRSADDIVYICAGQLLKIGADPDKIPADIPADRPLPVRVSDVIRLCEKKPKKPPAPPPQNA